MRKIQVFFLGLFSVGLLSIGVAFAETFTSLVVNGTSTFNGVSTFNDNVKVNGFFQVEDSPGGSAITVQNSGAFNAIKLWDIDDQQIYQFRLIGTGDRFDIVDISHNRVNLAVLSSNGYVSIGHAVPTEQLDVNGNLRMRGDIVSTTNLKIDPAGDLCLGSGC